MKNHIVTSGESQMCAHVQCSALKCTTPALEFNQWVNQLLFKSASKLFPNGKKPQADPDCGVQPSASTGWGGKKIQNIFAKKIRGHITVTQFPVSFISNRCC